MILALLQNNLVFHELMHGIVALPFSFLVYKKSKSIKNGIAVLVVSYFVDLDHLIDYIIYFGFDFNIYRFLSGVYFDLSDHAYVLLHAWEWLFVFGIISYFRGWRSKFTVLFFGLLSHLIIDTISVESIALYSIIVRVSMDFYIVQ